MNNRSDSGILNGFCSLFIKPSYESESGHEESCNRLMKCNLAEKKGLLHLMIHRYFLKILTYNFCGNMEAWKYYQQPAILLEKQQGLKQPYHLKMIYLTELWKYSDQGDQRRLNQLYCTSQDYIYKVHNSLAIQQHHMVKTMTLLHRFSQCIYWWSELENNYSPLFLDIFKPSCRIKKIFRICKSIGTNRSKLWQKKVMTIIFRNPPFNLTFNIDSIFNSPWNHTNLPRINCKLPKESSNVECSSLRHN